MSTLSDASDFETDKIEQLNEKILGLQAAALGGVAVKLVVWRDNQVVDHDALDWFDMFAASAFDDAKRLA